MRKKVILNLFTKELNKYLYFNSILRVRTEWLCKVQILLIEKKNILYLKYCHTAKYVLYSIYTLVLLKENNRTLFSLLSSFQNNIILYCIFNFLLAVFEVFTDNDVSKAKRHTFYFSVLLKKVFHCDFR